MASTQNEITVEEILALLKRTSLPTIVVEGNDDMIVYRIFEDKLSHIGVSVLPVGGRQKVLEVFRRRYELTEAPQLIFIADKDVWVHAGVPPEFEDSHMLFTHGYSIENDVYIDGELWNLLRGYEGTKYQAELNDFIEWYALALDRHLRDSAEPISLHPDHVLNPDERHTLLELRAGETYPTAFRDAITSDYRRVLRGKSLIALLLRNINYKGRAARHKSNALLESVAVRPGPILNDLYQRVEEYFSPAGASI